MPNKTKRRPSVTKKAKVAAAVCLGLATLLVLTSLFLQREETLQTNAAAASQFSAAPATIAPREAEPELVVIGDSMAAGSNNTVTWPVVVGETMPIKTTVLATGGAAYTQEREPLMDQAAEAIRLNPTIVVVSGAVGDRKSDPVAIKAAATQIIDALQEALPKAKIAMTGPLWDSTATSSGVLEVNAVVAEVANEQGVPFWDAIGEGWITDAALIQDDRLHPTDEGQQVIADRVAAKISELP